MLPNSTATVTKLKNGLTVIVEEDHSAPVASVQAWVETGSIHEGRFIGSGISHFLEHMMFKGTALRPQGEFARAVQYQGGYLNAYTSFDRTVYWIDIPSAGVPVALDLLSDALMHSTLPEGEFAKEQEVIRREFAMGQDDPDRVASYQFFGTAYREHPYRYPVIGHLELFNQLTRDDLAAYYHERYAPNNVTFVVAGDVQTEAVVADLERHFAGSPRRVLPAVLVPEEPPQLGRRESHEEFETELTRLHLAWHVPDVTHPDVPALDVLAVILGMGRSSRLYRALREKRGIVHHIDAWCWAPAQAGLFGIDAILDAPHREAVEAESLAVLEEMGDVSEEELAKARKIALSQQLAQLTTMRGKANDLGGNWLLARNLSFSSEYLKALRQVSIEDLHRVRRKYCREENLIVTSLNPHGSLAAKAKSSTAAAEVKIAKFELPNGLRLLVREDHRLPLVSMVTVSQAGLLSETPETNGITRLLAKTLIKGTATRSAEEIADAVESVGGSISSDGGNNTISCGVRILSEDFALGLDVLADVFTNAALPEAAIVREKEVQLAGIRAEEEEMTTIARNLLRTELYARHPYGLRAYGTTESVTALTREQLVAFRDKHLAARNTVMAVFGDVRAEEVRTAVEKAFAKLPAGEAMLAKVPACPALTESKELEAVKNKAQAVLMIGTRGSDFFGPDRIPLDLIDEACSDLGSRLFLRIREQMGLAYFVGTSHVPGLGAGSFVFYLGTDPLKIEEVKAALREEITRLAEGGLAEEELARAKAKMIGALEIRNQSNDALAFTCALDELYGLGFEHHRTLRADIEKVTLEQVRDVAQRYFGGQHTISVVVRPPADGSNGSNAPVAD